MLNPLSYRQIKELIVTDTGRVELIENCEPVFEEIDNANKQLFNNSGLTFSDYDVMTKSLTACVMFLKPIEALAEAYRHNVKHEKIYEYKKLGEKGTTDSVLKSRAEIAVKDFYELVRVMEAYISRAYCGIKDCERQTVNKKYEWKGLGKSEDSE